MRKLVSIRFFFKYTEIDLFSSTECNSETKQDDTILLATQICHWNVTHICTMHTHMCICHQAV